jgi:3-hydroxyisobutyrate dehydrogenase-like beta-hydroxyacid dehydrogenase
MVMVAVIAPGAMGAGVAKRLVENGVTVRTWLHGRSAASAARADAAGMVAVDLAGIAEVDLVLSIVPPAEALPLAEALAPALAAASKPPVYVDCNAISPQTAKLVADVMGAVPFIDAAIIGLPPEPGGKAPVFYGCGPHAAALSALGEHGIPTKLLTGPIGAASGLKMSYGGITKGLTGLAASMILAATRFGADDDLRAELAASQPHLLARFEKGMPDMFPKAYRWVAEMEEVAAFAGDDEASRMIYAGIAKLYQRLADDLDGDKAEICVLSDFATKR